MDFGNVQVVTKTPSAKAAKGFGQPLESLHRQVSLSAVDSESCTPSDTIDTYQQR